MNRAQRELPIKKAVLNEHRDVVIYLVRLLRGERLEEIGKQFGMVSSDN
jgi:chromosomal replication initiation ATPase DnaA